MLNKFVARQPIFQRDGSLFGYELLFRSSLENFFHFDQPDQASSSVLVDSFLLFGINRLTGGHKAFINFTYNLLVNDYVTLLPNEQLVVEILETVRPDERLIAACKRMKEKGYLIALDDFTPNDAALPLVRLADIIKIDFQTTSPTVRKLLADTYAPRGIEMLAEKVETRQQFQEAADLGYRLFQGYFFSKPELMSRRDVRASKFNYFRLLQLIIQPDPDLARVEEVVKEDPSLCYKLLRYLNSAAFAFDGRIRSVRHALTLLGLNEVRKWTSLVALSGLGEGKPSELVINAITRAKFCESLAPSTGLQKRSFDLFMMGLLSVMDAILDQPMSDVLGEVKVPDDVRTALLKGVNSFRYVYELVLAYERSQWQNASQYARSIGIGESAVAEAYISSVGWGEQILRLGTAA